MWLVVGATVVIALLNIVASGLVSLGDSVAVAGEGHANIVFVDAAVVEPERLVEGISDNALVYRIGRDGTGFDEIAEIVSRHGAVSGIHILSHGKPGRIQLGRQIYDATNVAVAAGPALQTIGRALASGGDILFYGCDVAAGPKGRALIERIAALSGADVAASVNKTGAEFLDGDWELEASAGPIDVLPVLTAASAANWTHLLANSTLSWDTRPYTDLLTAATDVVAVDGITVTTSGTQAGSASERYHDLYPTYNYDGYVGLIASEFNATTDNGTVSNTTRIDFSEPVYDLTFTLIDIDGGSSLAFRDEVRFGSSSGTFPSATTGSNVTYNAGSGVARAVGGYCSSGSGNVANCLLTATFPGPVTWITISHVAIGASGSDPAYQIVVMDDISFNTPPDATDNANSTTESSTVAGNLITDDDGSGTDSDNQDAAGMLTIQSVNGTPVGVGGLTINLASGATLTVQQDGSYVFDPNGGYESLGLGQSAIENFTYTVQDAEGLSNSDGSGTDSVAALAITVNGEADYDMGVSKLVDVADVSAAGITLNYTITVTNTGDTGMTGVNPIDVLTQGASTTPITLSGPTGDVGTPGTLDAGETWTYTGSHVVTQAQIDDAGDLVNGVDVTTNEMGATTRSASATTTITPVRSMSVSKMPDLASVNNAGDLITYTIDVTNTGTVTITSISVSDPMLTGMSCTPGSGANPDDLAPGAVATCTGTYTATQADFDGNGGGDGDIDNTATVTASPGLNESADAAVTINLNPQLTVSKTASDTVNVSALQTITYTYVVENTGNQTISNISLSDAHNGSGPAPAPSNETLTTDNAPFGDTTDAGIDGTWDTMGPGDVVTFTATYTVTQNDVDLLQ